MNETNSEDEDGRLDTNLSDTFDDKHDNFRLFKAYKEGQLDLNILSTQEAISAATAATVDNATMSSTLTSKNGQKDETSSNQGMPKSWCAPQSSSSETNQSVSPNKQFTLGSLLKPNLISDIAKPVCESQLPSLSRVLVSSANLAEENKSLRYHNLNPEYIFERLRQTKQHYQLSVLLVQVDVVSLLSLLQLKKTVFFKPDPYYPLKELCKICWTERLTLMLAWNMEEAARYLEAYKALENKPPDNLMVEPAAQTDHIAQVTDFLTSVRRITKADAVSALRKFDTVADIIRADQSTLEKCPGFGQLKVC
ncbi:Excision repair cross-complementation group 1 [Schistosoma haematobium]|uniref:Excision repair cross-complementation group 1 n=1 Tax=Schistosoma haematobium TaxID=6185 RepID=A0A922S1T8_SCHHA|nr:Excision repair cross-complementation group 1 [Schistosoma haematobium]KAH9590045.1 Excision repair cross-complementation group 1 [Schistosoma haematobium]